MTTLLIGGLGVPELLIILAVVLLLFGGSRLAGLGKSTGRALKEFKEETKSLKGDDQPPPAIPPATKPEPDSAAPWPQASGSHSAVQDNVPDVPGSDVRRDA
jgi:sec-independent protein translocase protein TatA